MRLAPAPPRHRHGYGFENTHFFWLQGVLRKQSLRNHRENPHILALDPPLDSHYAVLLRIGTMFVARRL